MNIFKTLLGSKLNPMIPIGRYIFKMVLGDYIMIDDINFEEFFQNGLSNIELDPRKVNRKLRGQPFLLDKGKIGKLSISVNTKWEVKIVIDSPTISIFPNLTQFVSGSNTISDYLDVQILGNEEIDEEKEFEENIKQEKGFFQGMLDKMEISIVINDLTIDIKLEKPSRRGASFFVRLEQFNFMKLKKTAPNTLYSFRSSITKIDFALQVHEGEQQEQIGTIRRIIKGPSDQQKKALEVNIDYMLINLKETLVLRIDMGSFQFASSYIGISYILKLVDKLFEYNAKSLIMNKELLAYLEKNTAVDGSLNDTDMFESFNSSMNASLYESFKSNTLLDSLRTTKSFLSSTMNLSKSFIKNDFEINQKILQKEHDYPPEQIFLEDEESTLVIDLDLNFQGVYLALLKSEINLSNYEWINEIEPSGMIIFSGLWADHFILRIENIQLTICEEDENESDTKSVLRIIDISLDDCKIAEISNLAHKTSKHTKYESFVEGDSNNISEFKTVEKESPITCTSILKFISKKNKDEFEQSPVISCISKLSKGIMKASVKIELIKISSDLCSLEFLASDEMSQHKLESIKRNLTEEIQLCDSSSFKKTENSEYYGQQSIKQLQRIESIILQKKDQSEFLDIIRDLIRRGESFQATINNEINQINEKTQENIQNVLNSKIDEQRKKNYIRDMEKNKEELLRKVKRKVQININVNMAGIIAEVSTCGERLLSGVSVVIEVYKIRLNVAKSISLEIQDNIRVNIGKSDSVLNTLVQISSKNGSFAVHENDQLMYFIDSCEVYLSPEILENLFIFVERAKNSLNIIVSDFSLLLSDTNSAFALMDTAFDLFKEESKIRGDVMEIYNKCIDEILPINELSGCLGMIGISLENSKIKEDLKKDCQEDLADTIIEQEDDWFVVDHSGVQSLKEYKENESQIKLSILSEMKVILRLELRNLLLNMSRDFQNPGSFHKTFLIHSLRMFDGFTLENSKSKPSSYKVELLEILSIDYNLNPAFKVKMTEDVEINKCYQTFQQIWRSFSKDSFFQVKLFNARLLPEFKGVSDKVEAKFSKIIFKVSLRKNTHPLKCLVEVIDDACHRIDKIGTIFSSEKTQSPEQTQIFNNSSMVIVSDTLIIDAVLLDCYRGVIKIAKMNISTENHVSGKLLRSIRIYSYSTHITDLQENVKRKDLHLSGWSKGFYKLLQGTKIQISSLTNPQPSGTPGTESNIQIRFGTLNSENSTKVHDTSISIDFGQLHILHDFLSKASSYFDGATSSTQFLFKKTSINLKEERIFKNEYTSKGLNDSVWYKVGVWEPEVQQIRKYLLTRFKNRDNSADQDKEIFEKTQLKELTKREDRLIVQFLSNKISIILLDSSSSIHKESSLEISLKDINISFFAKETESRKDDFDVKFVKYFVFGNLCSFTIEDKIKGSPFSKLISQDSEAISFSFRISEIVRTKNSTIPEIPSTIKRKASLALSSQHLNSKRRKMSIGFEELTSYSRYFDNVGVFISIKPLNIYLHDSTATFLQQLATGYKTYLKYIECLEPKVKSVEVSLQPFYCLDFFYLDNVDFKLYALSSTNLSLVNLLPNLELHIKEKYIEYFEGRQLTDIFTNFTEEIMEDLSYSKLIRVNLKNLPIIATLYKIGLVFEEMNRSRELGKVLSGLNKLAIIGILSIVKTGQVGAKTLSDLAALIGIKIPGKVSFSYFFEAMKSKLEGKTDLDHLKQE